MKRIIFFLLFTTNAAWAFNSFTIKDIQVEGLQRVAIGTIFNYLPLKVGDKVDKYRLANAVKSLYSHGMFKDVSIEENDGFLIVRVLERPVIDKIEFVGNKDISEKILLEAFKRLGVTPSGVLNKHGLEKATQELQQQYIFKGRYGTKVITHQTPLERNRVSLKIEVREGVQAFVQEVKFIGNNQIGADKLLAQIEMKPTNWWQPLSSRNKFSQELLLGDSTRMSDYYFNQGFKNFKLLSTNVVLTKDKKNIIVSYQLEEGSKFRINRSYVSGVEGTVLKKELNELVQMNHKQIYRKDTLIAIKQRLESKLSDFGYALSKVNPQVEIVAGQKLVDVEFVTDIGNITYIREIKIIGNVSTRDEVIRREIREYEGGRFTASEISISTARLRRLGFFSSVNIEVRPVEYSDNQVDIIYRVVEGSSGSARLGFTYSQNSGAGINVGLSHNNFLGSGNRYSLNFVSNKVARSNTFSVYDPYFTDYGTSISYNIFDNRHDTSKINTASYNKDSRGFGSTLGVPVNEYDRIYFGANISQAGFVCGSLFEECKKYTETYNSRRSGNSYQFDLLNLYLSWSRDSRNSAIFPTSGQSQQITLTKGVGASKFEKISLIYKQYFPFFERSAIKLTGDFAVGTSNIGDLPFFERYFVGGLGSVRGFTGGSLSLKNSNGRSLGGSFQTIFNFDFITPFILATDSPSVRMTTFVDAGYSFANQQEFAFNKLNSAYGIGVLWMTPVAPLSFTFARSIKSDNSANEQSFQFQIGYGF